MGSGLINRVHAFMERLGYPPAPITDPPVAEDMRRNMEYVLAFDKKIE